MTALQTTIKQAGWTLNQIDRVGDLAIYAKTFPGGLIHSYEVIKVRKESEKAFPNGRVTPAHEAYPSSESWGEDGWTYMTLKEAQDKLAGWRALCPNSHKRRIEESEPAAETLKA